MTLPEQSDRAVAQTREFLVRLASPYGEAGIKGIRREVRAEASRLLRHYPYSKSDEKRGDDDTSEATDIVTRLRNWRTVHLARLHLLMDEAADEMERLRNGAIEWRDQLEIAADEVERLRQGLSQKNDCPAPDNGAKQDTVGRTLARRITGLQSTLEGDPRFSLQGENRAIGEKPTLTDDEREAVAWASTADWGSNPHAATLRGLLERLT
jgi:hypothetical protein